MKIKLHQICEEGLTIEGQELPLILEFSEALYQFEQPIQYQLNILWVGDKSLLVSGRLSTVVRAQCVRTLEWFNIPIVIENFKCHVEVRGDEVDLTQEIREDILLALPANPVSPDAKPLNIEQHSKPKGGSQVWGTLDKLKIK